MGLTAPHVILRSKLGEPPESCDDYGIAWASDDGSRARVALSDGASTSTFSGQWAALLVSWFMRRRVEPTAASLERVVNKLGALFLRNVRSRPLRWHTEQKLQEGTYATLLGVSIDSDGTWRALAVGDSCMFHVRGEALVTSFPYTSWEEFAARPILACTEARANGVMAEGIRTTEGRAEPGDLLVFATDGLAQWFMRNVETKRNPWEMFYETDDAEVERNLELLINEERAERRMRNDDVACARMVMA